MSTVIKSYLAFILIILTVFVCAGIGMVNLDVQNARDYHAAVINEIENSNHADSVIDACVAEASSNGYELIISTYTNNSDASAGSNISKVVLKYDYRIDFLNMSSEKEIVGYAR